MAFYLSILTILSLCVVFCIIKSYSSTKEVAQSVRLLLYVLFIPVAANVVIAVSDSRVVNLGANIFYLVGTNIVLCALIRYVREYCEYEKTFLENVAYLTFALDSISVCLNPVFGHVFSVKATDLPDNPIYYLIDSRWYHFVHLALSFIVIVGIVAAVVRKIIYTSNLYVDRYISVVVALSVVVVIEFKNVFTKATYNNSMFGIMICGLMIYFCTIEYHHFFLTHKMFDKVFQNISSAAFFFDNNFNCLYMNPYSSKMFDIEPGDLETPKRYLLDFIKDNGLDGQESFVRTKKLEKISGDRIFQIDFKRLEDKHGKLMGAYVLVQDRTDKEKKAALDRYRADHDMMTDLLNPRAFHVEAERILNEYPDDEYLILTSNIKDFKLINDVFGREAGDGILIKIAALMKKHAVPGTACARLGADKFAMLIQKKNYNENELSDYLNQMLWFEDNREFPVCIHVGVYEVIDRSVSSSLMVDRAFMAINRIKNDNVTKIAWYNDEMRRSLIWEQTISGSLDEAIETRQIVPFVQAQVDATGKVEGAEVLVRWQHPTEGLMAPGRFIDILEKDGRIVNLDMFMWEEACRILRRWIDAGRTDLYLSVNISPKDFYFVDVYKIFTELIKKYELDPKMLRLEITESVMMSDVDMKMKLIDNLREAGFIVEMDDFGSGYSSLNLLKDMPVDILKIDMQFLRKTRNAERAKIILQQIVSMAQKLIIPVITEGVETEEQLNFLTGIGCEMFQGYYFAKPVSLEEFENRYFAA